MKNIKKNLEQEIAELEYFKMAEIRTTGFVSGRTANKLTNRKNKLANIKK